MDIVKIGTFIAKCRKDRQITQEKLADILNVSNKSVSKWENGICLPDSALYEPLCSALGITIGELFAGQRQDNPPDRALIQMLTQRLYRMSGKTVSFPEFDRALEDIAAFSAALKRFPSREAAIDHFAKETGASREECALAYDFYTGMFETQEEIT